MNTHMALKNRLSSEWYWTKRAAIWFFTSMNSYMDRKILVVILMILSKQYSCLGFSSCISSQMDLQNRFFGELFCAKRSTVWFFSCEFSNSFMNTHMSLQICLSREWFWATRADVWLISGMNTRMALQIRLLNEGFWTKKAAVWFLSCVSF